MDSESSNPGTPLPADPQDSHYEQAPQHQQQDAHDVQTPVSSHQPKSRSPSNASSVANNNNYNSNFTSNNNDNNNTNNENNNDRTSSSVPIQPVTVFNEPPPPPPPQHPDLLGDLFQDAVGAASLPAPFEGWTDLLSLPDSVLLSRLGGDGMITSTSGGSVSSLIGAGNLPGEVLTHPSRVLLRVLHRLSAEFRFLQMRQIDEADMLAGQKKESQNAMVEQMRKDNIAKIKALLIPTNATTSTGKPDTSKKSSTASSANNRNDGGFDDMVAQNAITSLEKRLFSQQQKTAVRPRAALPLSAAGSYSASRPVVNENQRLKTYWRARYQQACVELEEVEQEIALTSQELFEVDKVIGCNTNEQLKEMIERCRVAEETAHTFAENCRMEMKRAELAASRSQSTRSDSSQQQPQHHQQSSSSLTNQKNSPSQYRNTSQPPIQNDSFTPVINPSFVGSSEHVSASNLKEHELALLPFLVDSLHQHAPQAIQHAISIRLKTQELQQLESEFDQMRENVERYEQVIEKAHNDYATAVGRLPSHVSINFEQVIKSYAQLEMTEDALFDAQAAMNAERMQFTKQRHEGTMRIENEKCRLIEQKDRLRRDLRSAQLDLLRVERKRKDFPTQPITAKDFTSISNTMNPSISSSRGGHHDSNESGNNNNNNNNNNGFGNSIGNGKEGANSNVADAASHLETMRARVKIYELERQSLMLEAMRAGSVPGPQ